jgi:hypothetical protein
MCLESAGGGELFYWNWIPQVQDREKFGVVNTGIPYPVAELRGVHRNIVPVYPGDVYCFNGRAVHAVGRPNGPRTTISFLMARKDTEEIIYWT